MRLLFLLLLVLIIPQRGIGAADESYQDESPQDASFQDASFQDASFQDGSLQGASPQDENYLNGRSQDNQVLHPLFIGDQTVLTALQIPSGHELSYEEAMQAIAEAAERLRAETDINPLDGVTAEGSFLAIFTILLGNPGFLVSTSGLASPTSLMIGLLASIPGNTIGVGSIQFVRLPFRNRSHRRHVTHTDRINAYPFRRVHAVTSMLGAIGTTTEVSRNALLMYLRASHQVPVWVICASGIVNFGCLSLTVQAIIRNMGVFAEGMISSEHVQNRVIQLAEQLARDEQTGIERTEAITRAQEYARSVAFYMEVHQAPPDQRIFFTISFIGFASSMVSWTWYEIASLVASMVDRGWVDESQQYSVIVYAMLPLLPHAALAWIPSYILYHVYGSARRSVVSRMLPSPQQPDTVELDMSSNEVSLSSRYCNRGVIQYYVAGGMILLSCVGGFWYVHNNVESASCLEVDRNDTHVCLQEGGTANLFNWIASSLTYGLSPIAAFASLHSTVLAGRAFCYRVAGCSRRAWQQLMKILGCIAIILRQEPETFVSHVLSNAANNEQPSPTQLEYTNEGEDAPSDETVTTDAGGTHSLYDNDSSQSFSGLRLEIAEEDDSTGVDENNNDASTSIEDTATGSVNSTASTNSTEPNHFDAQLLLQRIEQNNLNSVTGDGFFSSKQ